MLRKRGGVGEYNVIYDVGECTEVAVPAFVGRTVAPVEPEEIDQDFPQTGQFPQARPVLVVGDGETENSGARSNARRASSAFPLARQRMVRATLLPTWANCSTRVSSNQCHAAKS